MTNCRCTMDYYKADETPAAVPTPIKSTEKSVEVITGPLPKMKGSYNLERAKPGKGSVSPARQKEIESSFNSALKKYDGKGFDLDNPILNIVNDSDDDGFAQYLGSTDNGRHVIRINENGRRFFTDEGLYAENIKSAKDKTFPMYVARSDEEMFIHEIAHAIQPGVKNNDINKALNDAYSDWIDRGEFGDAVSMYAEETRGEMFAETVTSLIIGDGYMPNNSFIRVVRMYLGL